MRSALVLFAVILTATGPLAAQSSPAPPRLEFEAASIKRSASERFVFALPRFQNTTTFTAQNVPVEALIWAAYGVSAFEVVEAPAWIREASTERFDVLARLPPATSRQDQQAMLRNLLADRFALRIRKETRDMPVYLLTRLSERDLGPSLKPVVVDCQKEPKACNGSMGAGGASYRAAQWSLVVQTIAAGLDRRLIDRTGLSGQFDFEFAYRRGLAANADDPSVDLFTAVRQQLGLKLDAGRAPYDVVVVESVSRPTPN
jgi:uncharacterized protein (TIGR03435 family)